MTTDNLYTKLVQEYNSNQWQKICSLDRFLRIKADTALEQNNAYLYNAILDVIRNAENDY